MALSGNFRSQMLWENIRKGDLTAVLGLLDHGTINLEERDEGGQTFLMVGCQQGEISLVRELLEAGIDPNAYDNDSWTALLYAAKDGHLEICIELLERGAEVDHRDLAKWTALMWASYKGRYEVVQELLERGADPNVKAEHNMSCLCWAAGRGHTDVARALLEKGAKVNSTDKYGTGPLIWACRKGHAEIVRELLNYGASADGCGMDSLTALLVATKGGYTEVVQALLEHDPNVNAVDKDGFTALTIAAKEGYEDITQELLAKDAYVNIADRAGDTILIHAVKGGYSSIVRALLNRYADVDVEGTDRKTALYWAVEKSHPDIVQLLLDNDADLEICTKDGDTPLMRAVRNRHELIVRQLLDKGAKVAVFDKKGDTALHISLRARSKRITELLLRNPRNSRLLYRPNKTGETPYSIDAYHQKGILTQIHGHRQLNASDGENLLGYEIYSSSLADILSEPSLNTPITVGLYAKWGSGKSFLIEKLKNEMKSFTKANDDNPMSFTWSLFIFLLMCNSFLGLVLSLAVMYQVGLSVGFGLFVLEYGFLGIIWVCSERYNVRFAVRASQTIGKKLQILTLLLQLLFCNPVSRSSSSTEVPLVKFLFSEKTKLTSVGGEKALGAMIAGLSHSVEKEFGLMSSRLFGVSKPPSDSKNYIGRFKTLCCIPLFVIVIFILVCFVTGIALFVTYKVENKVVNGIMIGFACIIGLSLITNVSNFGKAVISLIIPQRRRVMKAADNVHQLKLDGFMQVLKHEVALMTRLVVTVDRFTNYTTRLVVVVDGLDSCEQEKVLQVLDIIHALFNEENSPFVVILAVDPQIIIKGIDQNLKSVFHDTNVNGFDYLRNIVHLPFYLQSQGMQVKRQDLTKSVSVYDVNHESPTHNHKLYRHQESTVSQISGFSVMDQANKKTRHGRKHYDSVTQVAHSNFDISNTLTKNDYFSDINPKSMRRLMNIVAVTGRLLRAYNIEFNWYRLAAWVNLVEQWPYRLSWIILYFEEHDDLNEDVTLKFIYEKIEGQMPGSSDVEPLLEIDRNVRKLVAFLCSKNNTTHMLNISDLKKFLPCTINLDPYLRKLIKNLQNQLQSDIPLGMFSSPPKPPPSATGQIGPDPHEASRLTLRPTSARPNIKPSMYSQYGHGQMSPAHMGHFGQMGQFSPYGPMMYPGMVPHHFMGPGMGQQGPHNHNLEDPHATKKVVNPAKYISGYQGQILSKMSTEDVSNTLAQISCLNSRLLAQYQQAVLDNNINGVVLSQCDLDDLGKCLTMKFGDWQLFKSAVQALREYEDNPPEEEPDGDKDNDSMELFNMEMKARSSSDQSARSIHFAKQDSTCSVTVHEIEPDGTPVSRPSKAMFKRQSTVDTDHGESLQNFEAITEESEEDEAKTSDIGRRTGMPRNDSMVAEMIYESGLLKEFVHNFTEAVSEGDESEEDSTNDSASQDLIDMNSSSSGQSSKKHPVQFSLSIDSNSASAPSRSYEENQTNNYRGSDREPLIDARAASPDLSLTPLLHLPPQASSDTLKDVKSECLSEPDILGSPKESTGSLQRNILSLPLVSKASSNLSTGFTALHGQDHERYRSTDSMELVSVVDETRPSPAGPSLQASIEEYTRNTLTQGSPVDPGDRLPSPGAGGFTRSPADIITMKGTKKDGSKPESFV